MEGGNNEKWKERDEKEDGDRKKIGRKQTI
jgi:hypothetical protein